MKQIKADGRTSKANSFAKKMKNRGERRQAKRNPEEPANYGKYKGWLS